MFYSNVNSDRINTPYFRGEVRNIINKGTNLSQKLNYTKCIALSGALPSTTDGPPVMIYADSIRVPKGKTVTVSNRCCGLFLVAHNSIEIYGKISMTRRGAHTPKPYDLQIDFLNLLHGYGPDITHTPLFRKIRVNNENHHHVEFIGRDFNASTGGTGGRRGGADGAGTYSGPGAVGSIFSGGAGGSGSAGANDLINTPAFPYGGRGGETHYAPVFPSVGGPGAGNPGGKVDSRYPNGNPTDAQDGTGGAIFLISFGDIYLHPGSSLEARGANGGRGVYTNPNKWAGRGGGGGSGGGFIKIVYSGLFINKGTIDLSGGVGGVPETNSSDQITGATSGGTGTLEINKIAPRGTL